MPSSSAAATPPIVIDALLSEYPFPGFLDPVRKRAAEFERAHPEYRINVRGCYYEDLPTEVSRETLAGRPPTIASYYSGASQQAIDTVTADGRPLFTSVAREIGGRTEILGHPVVVDDLVDACDDFYRIGGEIVAVPLTLSTMLLYTNASLLRDAGVAAIPSTWDELTSACEAVARLDGGPAHAITWPNDGKLFQQAVAQQGGLLLDNDNGRAGRATTVDLTTPELMAYVRWWRDLHQRGLFLHTGGLEDWVGSGTAFVERKVAFRVGSSFESGFMGQAAAEAGFELAVSVLPHNGRVAPAGNWVGGDALWLAEGLDAATRDGALAFIQYLNTAEHAAEWHRTIGSTPVTKGAVALLEREGWFAEHPVHHVATRQLDRTDRSPGASTPVYPGSHGIQRAVMEAMADVLEQGAEPGARFARASAEAQKALDHYTATCLGEGPRDPGWTAVGS